MCNSFSINLMKLKIKYKIFENYREKIIFLNKESFEISREKEMIFFSLRSQEKSIFNFNLVYSFGISFYLLGINLI